MDTVYLGDSVYASYDGHNVILTTRNGYPSDPSNLIVMEPEVVYTFLRFIQNLKGEETVDGMTEETLNILAEIEADKP